MSRHFPPIHRHTREHNEVSYILGPRECEWIAADSVRQISNRWLKADRFVADVDGDYMIDGDTIPTRRVRIRIPKGNHMTRSRT